MRNFLGKTAIITGGANGIGKALAFQLAKRGARIALVDIDQENLRRTAFEIESLGNAVSQHVIDVSIPHAVSKLPEAVIEWHQHADILINCAGVSVTAPIEDQSIDDIKWITGINYLGTVYTCKYFVPLMQDRPEAAIINVSSAAGLVGFKNGRRTVGQSLLLLDFSEALHAELRKSKISVLCAIPGPVKTNIIGRSRIYDEELGEKERKYLNKSGMNPANVARKIISAVESERSKVYITKQSVMIHIFRRIFGNLFVKATNRFQDKLPA